MRGFDEPHAPPVGSVEGRRVIDPLHPSERLAKPILDVMRVDADVVVLTVLALTVARGRSKGLVRGGEVRIDRYLNQSDPVFARASVTSTPLTNLA